MHILGKVALAVALSALVGCMTSQAEGRTTAEVIAASAVRLNAGCDAGFDQVADAIGDARIVMLGEPWHGDGGAIRMRGDLVQCLHKRLGFDVLVFEADFYATHRGWEQVLAGRDVREMARENIYPFWSDSRASDALWSYVASQLNEARPLHVAGMDFQLMGGLSRERLPGELTRMLSRLPGVAPAEANRAARALAALIATPQQMPPAADISLLFRLVRANRQFLADSKSDPFERQLAESLERNLTGAGRDAAMAANMIWLSHELYPGKKIIVWAHNNHVLADKWVYFDAPDPLVRKEVEAMSEAAVGRFTYVGHDLRQYFGSKLFVVGMLSGAGRYSTEIPPALHWGDADFSVETDLPAPGRGTLEAALHQRGLDKAFLDLRPFRARKDSVHSRVLDYSVLPAVGLRIWNGYDALLYLDQTHGLQHKP